MKRYAVWVSSRGFFASSYQGGEFFAGWAPGNHWTSWYVSRCMWQQICWDNITFHTQTHMESCVVETAFVPAKPWRLNWHIRVMHLLTHCNCLGKRSTSLREQRGRELWKSEDGLKTWQICLADCLSHVACDSGLQEHPKAHTAATDIWNPIPERQPNPLVLHTLIRNINTIANSLPQCKPFSASGELTCRTVMCKHLMCIISQNYPS